MKKQEFTLIDKLSDVFNEAIGIVIDSTVQNQVHILTLVELLKKRDLVTQDEYDSLYAEVKEKTETELRNMISDMLDEAVEDLLTQYEEEVVGEA